ncbi:hypothetical protein [Kribbella sancticallisti]
MTRPHSTADELDGLINLADQLLDRLTQFRTEDRCCGWLLRNRTAAQPPRRIAFRDLVYAECARRARAGEPVRAHLVGEALGNRCHPGHMRKIVQDWKKRAEGLGIEFIT